MKALQHLQTINHHKYLVMKECFEVGLYKQGLLHDMSKYSPTEFLVGCKYYQGNRSPNNAEREGMVGLKMPLRYVVEMFMDRIAASKTYQGEAYRNWHPLEYYEKGAARLGKMIHPDTAKLLHELLEMLAEEGEEKTFSYIKHVLLKQKKY